MVLNKINIDFSKIIKQLLVINITFFVIGCVLSLVKISVSGEDITLSYDIILGVLYIDKWYKIFYLNAYALIVMIVNIFLISVLYKKLVYIQVLAILACLFVNFFVIMNLLLLFNVK